MKDGILFSCLPVFGFRFRTPDYSAVNNTAPSNQWQGVNRAMATVAHFIGFFAIFRYVSQPDTARCQ
tara:strand:+ start:343 stop:543 length:201 start_codon:yes stop_codon:yes gene_type:complete